MSNSWKPEPEPWTLGEITLHPVEAKLSLKSTIPWKKLDQGWTATPISREEMVIESRLPEDFRSPRLADLLYRQERCFERSILAIAQYHEMRIDE